MNTRLCQNRNYVNHRKIYRENGYHISHIMKNWNKCVADFMNNARANGRNYTANNFVTHLPEMVHYITVAFIYVRQYPNNMFYRFSGDSEGIFRKVAKQNGYICSNQNIALGAQLFEDTYIFCDVKGKIDPLYIYVDWETGIVQNICRLSQFSEYVDNCIENLRHNITKHIQVHWIRLFETIISIGKSSSSNLTVCNIQCQDITTPISNFIRVTSLAFIAVHSINYPNRVYIFFNEINKFLCENEISRYTPDNIIYSASKDTFEDNLSSVRKSKCINVDWMTG